VDLQANMKIDIRVYYFTSRSKKKKKIVFLNRLCLCVHFLYSPLFKNKSDRFLQSLVQTPRRWTLPHLRTFNFLKQATTRPMHELVASEKQ